MSKKDSDTPMSRMSGRPVLIKNLVPGMKCRILVDIGYSTDGMIAGDLSGIVFLTGRTARLRKEVIDHDYGGATKVSLYGHRVKDPSDNAFYIESVEDLEEVE